MDFRLVLCEKIKNQKIKKKKKPLTTKNLSDLFFFFCSTHKLWKNPRLGYYMVKLLKIDLDPPDLKRFNESWTPVNLRPGAMILYVLVHIYKAYILILPAIGQSKTYERSQKLKGSVIQMLILANKPSALIIPPSTQWSSFEHVQTLIAQPFCCEPFLKKNKIK